LKKEFSNIPTKFPKGSETLEHIISIQELYYNKLGLDFSKESEHLIDFPKIKDILR